LKRKKTLRRLLKLLMTSKAPRSSMVYRHGWEDGLDYAISKITLELERK
jgi:hypothetical protein